MLTFDSKETTTTKVHLVLRTLNTRWRLRLEALVTFWRSALDHLKRNWVWTWPLSWKSNRARTAKHWARVRISNLPDEWKEGLYISSLQELQVPRAKIENDHHIVGIFQVIYHGDGGTYIVTLNRRWRLNLEVVWVFQTNRLNYLKRRRDLVTEWNRPWTDYWASFRISNLPLEWKEGWHFFLLGELRMPVAETDNYHQIVRMFEAILYANNEAYLVSLKTWWLRLETACNFWCCSLSLHHLKKKYLVTILNPIWS